jgi:hypothetical protein
MAISEFITADQNWQEQSTTYWFSLSGKDCGTGYVFDGDEYGICESSGESVVVDEDGAPRMDCDRVVCAVRNTVQITDDLRRQVSGV